MGKQSFLPASVVTITRTGKFYDPRYGEFELTQQMFDALVKNFNENVYGQEINIDIAHQPEYGAGAVVRRLFTDRGRLRAEGSGTNSSSAKSPKKALNT
ncbi:hypothetical protein [Photobacterium halotolerans]|uniref:hypothetical protein n=1 Tax=Photobacterium halotolerans TaxID=265726 RepID=UPI001F3692F6|nr:hypothetical protein [Photobacterium halotolerans]